jgi:hypothetical protein
MRGLAYWQQRGPLLRLQLLSGPVCGRQDNHLFFIQYNIVYLIQMLLFY